MFRGSFLLSTQEQVKDVTDFVWRRNKRESLFEETNFSTCYDDRASRYLFGRRLFCTTWRREASCRDSPRSRGRHIIKNPLFAPCRILSKIRETRTWTTLSDKDPSRRPRQSPLKYTDLSFRGSCGRHPHNQRHPRSPLHQNRCPLLSRNHNLYHPLRDHCRPS